MYKPPLPAPNELLPFAQVPDLESAPGIFKVGEDVDEESLISQLLSPLEKEPGPFGSVTGQIKNQTLPNAMPYRGGETEALARLNHYFGGGKQAPAATYKDTRNEMLGADYSTKVSYPSDQCALHMYDTAYPDFSTVLFCAGAWPSFSALDCRTSHRDG